MTMKTHLPLYCFLSLSTSLHVSLLSLYLSTVSSIIRKVATHGAHTGEKRVGFVLLAVPTTLVLQKIASGLLPGKLSKRRNQITTTLKIIKQF